MKDLDYHITCFVIGTAIAGVGVALILMLTLLPSVFLWSILFFIGGYVIGVVLFTSFKPPKR